MHNDVVYFAHGKESGPWGTKISRLAQVAREKGFAVESPDYSRTLDPDERVEMLLKLKPAASRHLVLAGSSMGGYVSTIASSRLKVKGLFLLAPAFFKTGYKHSVPTPYAAKVAIVHGRDDDVIPAENSIRFAQDHKAELYLLAGDHRLLDVLPQVEKIFARFLDDILTPRRRRRTR